MAWFDRGPGEKKNPSEAPPHPPSSQVRPGEEAPAEASTEELVAYLYKGSRVTGQLTFHGRAKISGEVVVIRGKVEGDVAATEKVELETPARLLGNIAAPRLTVTEGAVFDGYCSMGGAREKREVLNPPSSGSEKAFESDAAKLP